MERHVDGKATAPSEATEEGAEPDATSITTSDITTNGQVTVGTQCEGPTSVTRGIEARRTTTATASTATDEKQTTEIPTSPITTPMRDDTPAPVIKMTTGSAATTQNVPTLCENKKW